MLIKNVKLFSVLFSEKLFTPLSKFIVPVFLGSKEVHDLAPPQSYIDVFDFQSPKHLVDYILYLNKSDEEYVKYFQWKRNYNIRRNTIMYTGVFCEFCKYLQGIKKPNVIHNFTKWFFQESECNNNKISTFLQQQIP